MFEGCVLSYILCILSTMLQISITFVSSGKHVTFIFNLRDLQVFYLIVTSIRLLEFHVIDGRWILHFLWNLKSDLPLRIQFSLSYRSKTISLEKLKLRLFHDVDSFESENKCLSEYRRELELLQQEKMAHVEELRQIHADINAMETIIKQAEESKRTAIDSARRIAEDYRPLKHEVDLMRTELLGLEKLPELANDEKERLSTVGILEKPKSLMEGPPGWPASMHAAMQHHQQLAAAAAAAAAVGNRGKAFFCAKYLNVSL